MEGRNLEFAVEFPWEDARETSWNKIIYEQLRFREISLSTLHVDKERIAVECAQGTTSLCL